MCRGKRKKTGTGLAPLCPQDTPQRTCPPLPPSGSCPAPLQPQQGTTKRAGLRHGVHIPLLWASRLCCHRVDSESSHPRISRQMCSQTPRAPRKGAWHIAKPCSPFKVTGPSSLLLHTNSYRALEQDWAAGDGRWAAMSCPRVPGDMQGPPWSLNWGHRVLLGSCDTRLRALQRKQKPPAELPLPAAGPSEPALLSLHSLPPRGGRALCTGPDAPTGGGEHGWLAGRP